MDQMDILPQLAVWPISKIYIATFQSQLNSSSSHPGEAELITFTLGSGLAGILDRVVIPFQDLFLM